MDISGPVRQLLRQHLPESGSDPLLFAARVLAHPGELARVMPGQITQTARLAHEKLALSVLLRVLLRVGREIREPLADRLTEEMQKVSAASQKLLFSRTVAPVEQLWFYWLLVLARKRLKFAVPEMQLKVLWQNAWTRQNADGALHAVGGDVGLDGATYNDLVAVHAAYNAVLLTGDFDLFVPVQKLVDFHVARTQPDHVTSEPWGLAAFAALDETNTFAGQQVHDATTQLAGSGAAAGGANPVILALLADALMAQEEAAEA